METPTQNDIKRSCQGLENELYKDDKPVAISYNDLVSPPGADTPTDTIEHAFGSDDSALGILIVKDLPEEYKDLRERLLKLSYKFANLPDNIKEKYTDPKSGYFFGWSHGKDEIITGKPDSMKGSYFANPLATVKKFYSQSQVTNGDILCSNIWPDKGEKDMEGFEVAYKELAQFIHNIGLMVVEACQPFISSYLLKNKIEMHHLISPHATKGRLLHYFPSRPHFISECQPNDWCAAHTDYGLLTGLCAPIYLRKQPLSNDLQAVIHSKVPDAGLHIKNNAGYKVKVTIPDDCLAFQVGAVLEAATGGWLKAHEHYVNAGSSILGVSRETFALFIQPNSNQLVAPSRTFDQLIEELAKKHRNSSDSHEKADHGLRIS